MYHCFNSPEDSSSSDQGLNVSW